MGVHYFGRVYIETWAGDILQGYDTIMKSFSFRNKLFFGPACRFCQRYFPCFFNTSLSIWKLIENSHLEVDWNVQVECTPTGANCSQFFFVLLNIFPKPPPLWIISSPAAKLAFSCFLCRLFRKFCENFPPLDFLEFASMFLTSYSPALSM